MEDFSINFAYFLLVIDWEGETGHVIGKIYVDSDCVKDLNFLSLVRRTIRLE
jgi:hypothetical protein